MGNRIPNIPFFYLVYRGWSHWRGKFDLLPSLPLSHTNGFQALGGSKHLEFLLQNDLLNPVPFKALEQLYTDRVSSVLKTSHSQEQAPDMVEDIERSEDKQLLQMSDAKQLATILDAPELALEAERAIVQVEHQFAKQQKSRKRKDVSKSKPS